MDHGARAHRVALVDGVKTELDPIHVEKEKFLHPHHGATISGSLPMNITTRIGEPFRPARYRPHPRPRS
jgi:hypothetical protein